MRSSIMREGGDQIFFPTLSLCEFDIFNIHSVPHCPLTKHMLPADLSKALKAICRSFQKELCGDNEWTVGDSCECEIDSGCSRMCAGRNDNWASEAQQYMHPFYTPKHTQNMRGIAANPPAFAKAELQAWSPGMCWVGDL